MTLTDDKAKLDIAAAKLGLATDSQIFDILLTAKVDDKEVLPIMQDIRKAKQDGIATEENGLKSQHNGNVFLSIDSLVNSKYEGVRKFAELIKTQSDIEGSLDRIVQQPNNQPVKGVVFPLERKDIKNKIANITQTSDINNKTVKENLVSLRLSIASKRQIRDASSVKLISARYPFL